AEDGIRDLTMTGVQTCALPISKDYLKHQAPKFLTLIIELHRSILRLSFIRKELADAKQLQESFGSVWLFGFNEGQPLLEALLDRSEERRVGKECRFRWWMYQ